MDNRGQAIDDIGCVRTALGSGRGGWSVGRGCAHTRGAPVFSTAEAAAIWGTSYQQRDVHAAPLPTIVNIPPTTSVDSASLRMELSLLFDVRVLLRSDSVFGGRRNEASRAGDVVLNARPRTVGARIEVTMTVSGRVSAIMRCAWLRPGR